MCTLRVIGTHERPHIPGVAFEVVGTLIEQKEDVFCVGVWSPTLQMHLYVRIQGVLPKEYPKDSLIHVQGTFDTEIQQDSINYYNMLHFIADGHLSYYPNKKPKQGKRKNWMAYPV